MHKGIIVVLIALLTCTEAMAFKDYQAMGTAVPSDSKGKTPFKIAAVEGVELPTGVSYGDKMPLIETTEVCQGGYVFVLAISVIGYITIVQKEVEVQGVRRLQPCTEGGTQVIPATLKKVLKPSE